MFYLKSGVIRIFKKKGESSIEIDTIHSGQILGELAFLDGNPRSASGEALTDCDLMEISGPTFQAVLVNMPDWLKMLLKAVVGRLRTASTRIRQLESASTSFDYSETTGKRAAHYVYLSPSDVMKILTGILLVASRNGTMSAKGIDVRTNLLQRYTNQIMGIPVAKTTTLLDVLSQVGLIELGDEASGNEVILTNPDFLEQLIVYLNEENLIEPAKRHDLTLRGYLIMSLVSKNIAQFPKDETTGQATINIAAIQKQETPEDGKEPFRIDEFTELVKLGYATDIDFKSADEAYAVVKPDAFMKAYRMQKVVMAIAMTNEQKKKSGSAAK